MSKVTANFNDPISPFERVLLGEIALGLSNTQIAKNHSMSLDGMKYHLANVYVKLDAKNRAHAVYLAMRRELIK